MTALYVAWWRYVGNLSFDLAPSGTIEVWRAILQPVARNFRICAISIVKH